MLSRATTCLNVSKYIDGRSEASRTTTPLRVRVRSCKKCPNTKIEQDIWRKRFISARTFALYRRRSNLQQALVLLLVHAYFVGVGIGVRKRSPQGGATHMDKVLRVQVVVQSIPAAAHARVKQSRIRSKKCRASLKAKISNKLTKWRGGRRSGWRGPGWANRAFRVLREADENGRGC